MRYAAALSLSGSLRAAEVPSSDIALAIDTITSELHCFSPEVEPADDAPGVFWLNASGLARAPIKSQKELSQQGEEVPHGSRLYETLLEWARLLSATLERNEAFRSTVVVGFQKFATYAVARAQQGAIVIFRDPEEESRAAARVALEKLSLQPTTRDRLYKLAVHTLGDFLALPQEGIEKRFGTAACRLHRLATGDLRIPFAPTPAPKPLRREVHLDHAETDVFRLVAWIGRLLEPLLETLTHRDQGLREMQLELHFESGDLRQERLRPAAPTTDLIQLTELARLRLESIWSPGGRNHRQDGDHRPDGRGGQGRSREQDGVTNLVLTAKGARLTRRQLELFAEAPPRDLDAASRALARLRAEFGEEAVVCAHLREGHLPEALFVWKRLERVRKAAPRYVETPRLVRRIYTPAMLLPARPRHEPDGWMLRSLEQGPVVRVLGPYVISGGWWRKSIHREYHFAETQKGELLWVYYDRFRRRWYLQGRVE